MSKSNAVAASLPPVAKSALRQLGEGIAIARARRKESQRAWAERIGISLPTLIRLEKGDPTVSMAAYASALWLMGRVQALGEIAAPSADIGALELNVRDARKRGSVRAPASISARLGEKNIERK
ncbi:MAG: XRE family transcriptional regulator [Casimicrobiaceae bacterium]